MGSNPRSSLPEDCHGAGKASGSVKSCIDWAVLGTGSSELAGLEGEEKVLWAWEVFTLLDAALVPQERPTPQGRELITGQVARLLGVTTEREGKKDQQQEPQGRDGSGHLANGTACSLLSSTRAYYPWHRSIPLGFACPGTPQKPQLPGNLSRALKQQPPPKGACSGKNKAPTLKAHPASQGAPEQYL